MAAREGVTAMSVRSLVLGLCFGLVVYSGASLLAAHANEEDVMLCCDSSDDCHGGKCCDPGSIGQSACSPDKPGICMATCVRESGH
jgi:hypothetical protein